MSEPIRLPSDLRRFVDGETWTYAKTYPEWPHEYLVRDRVDGKVFEALVRHIREHGSPQRFYDCTFIYYLEDGLLYWTMGEPIEETVIINRCQEEESYENRLKAGTLPEDLDRQSG